MALSAYLKLTGKSQGSIQGPVTEAGREEMIEVFGWNHAIISPLDTTTGMARGRRQHNAITITKPIDRTTPSLMRAFVTNEPFTSWTLEIWQTDMTGMMSCQFRIELANAVINSVTMEQLNNQHPEHAAIGVREHMSFIYQKIVWNWVESGAMAEDSWMTRI